MRSARKLSHKKNRNKSGRFGKTKQVLVLVIVLAVALEVLRKQLEVVCIGRGCFFVRDRVQNGNEVLK